MLDLAPLTINAWIWIFLFAFWFIASIFVYPIKVRETFFQRVQHVVPLYLGFYLIFSHRWWGPMHDKIYDNDAVRYGGDVLTAAGAAFAIWARVTLGRYWSGIVTLKQGHKLIRTGPYRIARHPLYTGFVLASIGSAITAARIDGYVGLLIIVLSLIFKLRREESFLTGEFGEEYHQFKRDVPAALIPLVY